MYVEGNTRRQDHERTKLYHGTDHVVFTNYFSLFRNLLDNLLTHLLTYHHLRSGISVRDNFEVFLFNGNNTGVRDSEFL